MQVCSSQFADAGRGHAFICRALLSKATARKCMECSGDVFEHSRCEVLDEDVLRILEATADAAPSVVFTGELLVGGYKSVLKCDEKVSVVNCAGKKLHDFLPTTRPIFDRLRAVGRLLDLEWVDSDSFVLPQEELLAALAWTRQQVADGHPVLFNCAQGKSRSGAAATAYLMHTRNLPYEEALSLVKAARSMVEPNPGFERQMRSMEAVIRLVPEK
eukprot:CAMPEP_0183353832 /NCGR_PEP_ID=MMETSP0164_2-20130417/35274_1 /TAXON_ID=221442 /ORGANISM="Coccolithus pelagicus ssp braarudi, Strain PLY182g" /LENGTH=215 /DNA_ID=CAMNT_0025526591 /DNA_START=139 /DNA_END=786 /DNA_ORIENTATION=+